MNVARRPVKDINDNKRRWRDKFKQQCNDRMKDARQEKIDKIREEQWMRIILEKEWEKFKLQNEKAMKEEGITNADDLIEQSLQDYQQEANDFHVEQEQKDLENAIAQYQESLDNKICFQCQRAYLGLSTLNNVPVLSCPNCGFFVTERCFIEVEKSVYAHGATCSGSMDYALEPGADNTLLAVCNVCDLWTMFPM